MCPTWHFVYIFFNPVFQVSTAKNEINLFNNHILIVAPVSFAPAGAMTPSAEFLFLFYFFFIYFFFFFFILSLVFFLFFSSSLLIFFSFFVCVFFFLFFFILFSLFSFFDINIYMYNIYKQF